MELNNIVKNLSFNVDIRSILDNPDNKLDSNTYANLYDYFINVNGQSYHTLVNSKMSGIREEFYLLMNDVDIILITIDAYGLDYEIKHDLLTVYIYIKDYQEHPAKIPFIYNLNDLMTLYELDILLKQENLDLFFIELINNILMIEYRMEVIMPNEFKENLRNDIDGYIQNNGSEIIEETFHRKPVITIKKTLLDMSNVEKNYNEDFVRYNWVDVKDIAKKIFWNYSFEIAWAEDAWNILMFSGVIRTDNIIGAKCTDFEYGDIILWLVAMYEIYYSYKVAADYESIHGPTLLEHIYDVHNAEKYIGTYLNDKIYQELNDRMIEGSVPEIEFYDIESGNFVFSEDSIAFEVYIREIQERCEIIKRKTLEYFDYNDMLIEFMGGIHWVENYFDMDLKKDKIVNKFEKILGKIREGHIVKYYIGEREFEYENEDEVNEDMEEELNELEHECNGFTSDAQQGQVYAWIDNGMEL
jgi:hypothetical protein